MRRSTFHATRGFFGLSTALIVSCTSSAIREIAPSYTSTAKQNALVFRDCVADVMADRFGSQPINKFSNGIIMGADISVLIEQVGGMVYVYESDELFSGEQLPVKAAASCNESPKPDVFELR